jgi:hypothetical protein
MDAFFDYMKDFFNNKDWEEKTNNDKNKNYFMLQRMLSIKYPIEMNTYNHIKIDKVATTELMRMSMLRIYKSGVPRWIYTKTKTAKKKTKPKYDFSKYSREISKIMETEMIDKKHMDYKIQYNPEGLMERCKKMKAILDQKVSAS